LTVKAMLEARGHEIVAVITGNGRHPLPAFFREEINAPIFLVESPGFVMGKDGQGVKTISSVLDGLRRSPEFFHSIQKIAKIIKELSPDRLISFFEPLAGIYYRIYREKRPLFCIGHQYFIAHPSCQFPSGHAAERRFFVYFNRLNAPRKCTRIALSFTAEADQPDKRLFIVPPLIRPIIRSQKPSREDFLLVYLLDPGYRQQISSWSLIHPETRLDAFSSEPPEASPGSALIWHELSGTKFIDCLARCRAYISTAGFDSIAEAAYLGKDIMMVPTKNHYEQMCNAVDANRAGLAISAENFDLDIITSNQTKTHSERSIRSYQEWVDNNSGKVTDILER